MANKMSDNASEVFDYNTFRDRMLNDDQIIVKLVSGILEKMPKMIDELWGYIERGEIEPAGRQAHTIKGAAANLGCELLRKSAWAIEFAAEGGSMNEITVLFPQLEMEWKRLKPLLRNVTAEYLK